MLVQNSIELLSLYQAGISGYDEILDKTGNVKPFWRSIFANLQNLGLKELSIRNEEIKLKLKENGVSYNIYGFQNKESRQWQLDPIPFLLDQKEWKLIENGLKQRAIVYDLMLQDLYGPCKLIKDKIIPPDLLYSNTGFFRQCFDVKNQTYRQLSLYAVDIARGPDGRMWVLDNRTQAPSGSGYALENRSVLTRLLPELSENLHFNKLSPFFITLQKTINDIKSFSKNQPFVVYLTPGPLNETYFEHSYLASYLGYTLAQGEDLIVRDSCVWLKTIEGLHKIDVIIRRIDDDYCDPLEFKDDSRLGVPGLLHVIRRGNVTVLNAPGSSVLENHGFMAFLNNVSKYFLGEELLLPSLATWWCGQNKELAFVLENIDKLIIKKANRNEKFRSIYGGRLSEGEKNFLKEMIMKSPSDFVAQEEVNLSTTPSFNGETIEPRYASMRCFLVNEGTDYYVMKGGLTRCSPEKDKFIVSGQYGGISKDTWIISDILEQQVSTNISINTLDNPKNIVLSSRSAENLYWVGRYCERSLIEARTIINLINSLNTQKHNTNTFQHQLISVLLKSLTHLTLTYPGFLDEKKQDLLKNPSVELYSIITDINKPGSIAYNLKAFLDSVEVVKDKWTIGTWRVIDMIENIYIKINGLNSNNIYEHQRHLEKLHTRIFTFYGIVNETMSKENSFYIFEFGKLLERTILLTSHIRSLLVFKMDESLESELIEFLLYNYHSLLSYRSKYKTEAKIGFYLDLVILETQLPFSLSFLMGSLISLFSQLPKQNESRRISEIEKLLLESSMIVKLANIQELCEVDEEEGYRVNLDDYLANLYQKLNLVSNTFISLYFSHTGDMKSFSVNGNVDRLDEI